MIVVVIILSWSWGWMVMLTRTGENDDLVHNDPLFLTASSSLPRDYFPLSTLWFYSANLIRIVSPLSITPYHPSLSNADYASPCFSGAAEFIWRKHKLSGFMVGLGPEVIRQVGNIHPIDIHNYVHADTRACVQFHSHTNLKFIAAELLSSLAKWWTTTMVCIGSIIVVSGELSLLSFNFPHHCRYYHPFSLFFVIISVVINVNNATTPTTIWWRRFFFLISWRSCRYGVWSKARLNCCWCNKDKDTCEQFHNEAILVGCLSNVNSDHFNDIWHTIRIVEVTTMITSSDDIIHKLRDTTSNLLINQSIQSLIITIRPYLMSRLVSYEWYASVTKRWSRRQLAQSAGVSQRSSPTQLISSTKGFSRLNLVSDQW